MKRYVIGLFALSLTMSFDALSQPRSAFNSGKPFRALSEQLSQTQAAIERLPHETAGLVRILLGQGATHWVSVFNSIEDERSDAGGTANTVINILNLSPVQIGMTITWRDEDGSALVAGIVQIPPNNTRTYTGPTNATWVEVLADDRVLVDGQVEVRFDSDDLGTANRSVRKMTWYPLNSE